MSDVALLAVLLAPLVVMAVLLLRGYATGPLVRALLQRYRWINAVFVLLIAVSVGTGVGLVAQERALRVGTAESASKFDLIVGAPGSELTLMLAAVYLRPSAVQLVDGEVYEAVASHPRTVFAAPLAFGDSYAGAPVVGTTADFVEHLGDGVLEGRVFDDPFEAVAGAGVPVEIGEVFVPLHGVGDQAEAGLHDDEITVVGRLPVTGSPWDHAILTPVEGVWLVHGLADGHAPENAGQIGPPFDAAYFPGTPAIVVRGDGLGGTYMLQTQFSQRADTMAFFPGAVLSRLYGVMGDVRNAMSLMATVTQVLVALGVLTGLFILTRLYARQLALLRVLGASTRFVLAVVWSYSVVLLALGTVLGVLVGFAVAGVLSGIVAEQTNILIEARLGWREVHLAAGFLGIASVLSVVPGALSLSRPAVALRQV
ncbi:MAG: FtsX-like permease family protein [Pseudomonadota bacterium]